MRQAGILAAAGIVALTEMVDRLADDHENARKLAQGLANMEGLFIDLDLVSTNIVNADVTKKGMKAQIMAGENWIAMAFACSPRDRAVRGPSPIIMCLLRISIML